MCGVASLIYCSALFCTDLLSAKLPSVPEEYIPDDMFRGRGVGLDLVGVQQQITVSEAQVSQPQPIVQPQLQQPPPGSPLQYSATIFAQPETGTELQPSASIAFQQGTFVTYD
jgi:hypothetical protein